MTDIQEEMFNLLHERIVKLEDKQSIIYDSHAVWENLSAKASQRTSPENVTDVLDAINKIWRE